MNYSYTSSPIQSRIDYLTQQRNMIDSQLQSMQQMAVPPININNQITPAVSNNETYDFNGKWVDNEEQIKSISHGSTPLLLFDNNNPIFYIKNTDGTIKKFQFEEVTTPPQINPLEEKVNILEGKIDSILNALQGQTEQTNVIVPTSVETPHVEEKQPKKQGGKNNG